MSDQGQYHSRNTFGKTPAELLHDTTVTDGAARLYAHMSWRFGSNKSNFEGQMSMAKYMGVSRMTIHNRIDELAARDWVVIVYRGRNKKSGGYTTPFYHVFDNQEDCKAFRAGYETATGEEMAPKPQPKERKSRKGKGGNPNLGRVNSGLEGADNSGLHRRANSGLNELDSSYLDSVYLDNTKDSAPVGAAAVEPSSDIDLLAEGIDVTPNPDEDATTPDFGIEETPMPEAAPIPPPPNVPAQPPSPVAAKFNIDKVFDCVAWGSFGIKDMRAVNGNGGRIGKLTSGLKRRYPGLEEKDIAAKSREFYKWFRSTYADISAPRDPSKFEERWIEWEQRDEAAPDAVPAVTYDDDEVHWVDLNETIFSKLQGGA